MYVAHLGTNAILKGWKSFSPGLRGTSYPGRAGLGWRTQSLWDWEDVKHITLPAWTTAQLAGKDAGAARHDSIILQLGYS